MADYALVLMCKMLVQGLRGTDLRKALLADLTSNGVTFLYQKANRLSLIPKKGQPLLDQVYLIALAKKLSWGEQDSEMIRAACCGQPLPQPSRMATTEEILATFNFLKTKDFLQYLGLKAVPMNVFWYTVGYLFPGAGYIPQEGVSEEGVLTQLGIQVGGAVRADEPDFVILEEVRGSGSTG